jgi:hypothetical protein
MTKPFAVALCALLLVTVAEAIAGPLTPPAGPVSPTPGPEPRKAVNTTNAPGDTFGLYRINQPGSYYLESNISVPAGVTWGISVEAAGVTLDLNGFTIDGNNAGGNGGVRVGAPGVLLRNGTIRNVERSGVFVGNFPVGSPGLTIENVRVLDVSGAVVPPGGAISSGAAGILAGRGAIIRNCYVNNAAVGIAAGYNANISGCTVELTRQFGINIEGGAMVSDCVVVGVGGGPTDGHAFVLGLGSSVENCVARSNTGAGFVDSGESAFTNCRATNNSGAGFVVAGFTRLDGCHAVSNTGPGVSIPGGDEWEITRCSFLKNTGGGVILSGTVERGRINDCTIRGIDSGLTSSIGVKVPAGGEDIVITNCTFSRLNRVVELDGSFCRVTNNAFNFSNSEVARSDGTAPAGSNFIGPSLAPLQADSATNPFANTSQ